jgi:hypothetical protein
MKRWKRLTFMTACTGNDMVEVLWTLWSVSPTVARQGFVAAYYAGAWDVVDALTAARFRNTNAGAQVFLHACRQGQTDVALQLLPCVVK